MAKALSIPDLDLKDRRVQLGLAVAGVAVLGGSYLIARRIMQTRIEVDAPGAPKLLDTPPPPGEAVSTAKGDVYFPHPENGAQRNANYVAAYNMVTRAVQAGLFGGGDTLPLLAVIWGIGESAGNPWACKRAEGTGFWGNGARGFYQARPTTAWNVHRGPGQEIPLWDLVSGPQMEALCGNLPVQTVLWLAARRRQYSRLKDGQTMNAIAARSGGSRGVYVSPFAAGDYSDSPGTIERFKKAYGRARAKGFDLPADWEDYATRKIPKKGVWPGHREVGKIIGVPTEDLPLLG